jgi:hypothetical protein
LPGVPDSQIGHRLKREADEAHSRYLEARSRFEEFVGATALTHNPPSRDAILVHRAGEDARAALRDYCVALRLFLEFMSVGRTKESFLISPKDET